MLGADLHAPERAMTLGLVDELSEDPLGAARARLATLSGYPLATYRATKMGLHQVAFEEAREAPGAWDAVLDAWMDDAVRDRMRALLR